MTPRLLGMLFSGFTCKLYAVGLALWVSYEAAQFLQHAFAVANAALPK